MNNPLNSNGICDSLQLIEYRKYLENEVLEAYTDWVENHNEHCEEGQELEIPDTFEEIEYLDEEAFTSGCNELIGEYEAIRDLCDELDGYSDFQYGEIIIGRDYFEEAMRELCEDLGEVPRDLPSYIENNIDWAGVASDLEVDYMTFHYDNNEYLMRA